jgi:hypothetical protein
VLHRVYTYTGDRKRKRAMTFPETQNKNTVSKRTTTRASSSK